MMTEKTNIDKSSETYIPSNWTIDRITKWYEDKNSREKTNA